MRSIILENTRPPWRLNVVPGGGVIGVRFIRFGIIVVDAVVNAVVVNAVVVDAVVVDAVVVDAAVVE